MFQARKLSIVLAAFLIALAATAAPAQSVPETPRRGRFLDILKPGKHVRISRVRPPELDGIEVTLVSAAVWKKITEGAEKIEKRIAKLETQRKELEARNEELEKEHDAAFSALRHSGRSADSVIFREIQAKQDKLQRELRGNHFQIEMLRRHLPSRYPQITILGEDYFAIDKGYELVCYPASRVRQITILKEMPRYPPLTGHRPMHSTTRPPQKHPSRANNDDAESSAPSPNDS